MYPLDHVGVAVTSIDQGIAEYKKGFSLEVDLREVIPSQKVEIAFLKLGNSLIELLAPTDESSTIAKFLKTKGPGLHHICFRVNDIRAELKRLNGLGYQLIDQEPRPGAHNSLIAFIHPKSTSGSLIELCQRRA